MNRFNKVVLEANAKINLFLKITGMLENGYHSLETVMQSIDMSDTVTIIRSDGDTVSVTCSDPNIPQNEENIAYKAAKAFFLAAGIKEHGISVHIDKSIPEQAGLAGGSADAAAVLNGLDALLGTALGTENLCEIGARIGADVPFCLLGGTCLAKGKGEVLTRLKSLPECYITVAKPDFGMSTRDAYKLYDETKDDSESRDIAFMLAAIDSGDLKMIGDSVFSSFSAIGKGEDTGLLCGIMLGAGACGAAISGSGSAVFGIFKNEDMAGDCLSLLRERVNNCRLVRPAGYGVKITHIS